MNKMDLRERITESFRNFNHYTLDYLGGVYVQMFSEIPMCYRIYWENEHKLNYLITSEDINLSKRKIKYRMDDRLLFNNLMKHRNELGLAIFCYSSHEYMVLTDKNINKNTPNFLLNITFADEGDISSLYKEVYCKEEDIEAVFNLLKPYVGISEKEEKCEFGITAVDTTGYLYTSWYDYSNPNIDIKVNYNDDIPYDHICNIIEREGKPDLMLFYGEPGTGKSSFIKHLICTFPQKEFVFLDGGILVNVQQDKLMSYFLDNQNTIFILEDCEKALMSREHNYNPIMPILLNITDGIIGDVLGIKLICTFNTNLQNVDKALLRKGRLSLKYEFKNLDKEKVKKIIGEDISKDMCLADVYNYKEENDFSKKNSKKIGF